MKFLYADVVELEAQMIATGTKMSIKVINSLKSEFFLRT